MSLFGFLNKRIEICAAVKTHPGKIRSNNEDNYLLCDSFRKDLKESCSEMLVKTKKTPQLFAVCDGMGGEEYGEIASLLAVQNLKMYNYPALYENARMNIESITVLIDQERLRRNVSDMGCTLAALYIDSGYAVSCNIGDSRVYHMRQNEFVQLSEDHRGHGNALLQYLGVPPEDFIIEPFFHEPVKLKAGDKFLLCSDGITDMIDDNVLCKILNEKIEIKRIVDNLVDTALDKGGKDNITAMVIDIL